MKITDSAKKEIYSILDLHKGKSLRVFMNGFGWGGPNLGVTLDESKSDDKIHQINGIDILVSERDKSHVQNFTIDYIDDFRGKGLIIQSDGACW